MFTIFATKKELKVLGTYVCRDTAIKDACAVYVLTYDCVERVVVRDELGNVVLALYER